MASEHMLKTSGGVSTAATMKIADDGVAPLLGRGPPR